MFKLPKITLAFILPMLAIAAAGAVALHPTGDASANTRPASDCAQTSCLGGWVDYWFPRSSDVTARADRSIEITQATQMPRFNTLFAVATNGQGEITHSLKLVRAQIQHRVAPKNRASLGDGWTELQRLDRGVIRWTEPDAGAWGLAQHRVKLTIEVSDGHGPYQISRWHYSEVKFSNPSGCREVSRSNADGYWRVVGINDANSGGAVRKNLSPDAANGDYCALNGWAQRETNYHVQACNQDGCAFPEASPRRLHASDFRRSAFDRGIAEVESHEDNGYTGYSVSHGNGQTTFDMEVWPWIKERFDDMTGYVVFARCTDLRCDVNDVIRGNRIDQYVTR